MFDKLYFRIIFSIYKVNTHMELISQIYNQNTTDVRQLCKSVLSKKKEKRFKIKLILRLTTQGKNRKVMRCVIRFYSHKCGLICTINPI